MNVNAIARKKYGKRTRTPKKNENENDIRQPRNMTTQMIKGMEFVM